MSENFRATLRACSSTLATAAEGSLPVASPTASSHARTPSKPTGAPAGERTDRMPRPSYHRERPAHISGQTATFVSALTESASSDADEPAPGVAMTLSPISPSSDSISSLAARQSLSKMDSPRRFTVPASVSASGGSSASMMSVSTESKPSDTGTDARLPSTMTVGTPVPSTALRWSSPMSPAPGESTMTMTDGPVPSTMGTASSSL